MAIQTYFKNFIYFIIFSTCILVETSTFGQANIKKTPPIKLGGYLIYEKNGHGLIATVELVGKGDFEEAKKKCDDLLANGFDDWRLPTKEEFDLIHPKLNFKKLGNVGIFKSTWYWTSTEIDKGNALTHNLNTGMQTSYFKDFKCNIMAVRSF